MDRTRWRKLGISVLAALCVLGGLEAGLRAARAWRGAAEIAPTVDAMMRALPQARIEGHEIGNQMLVHNIALMDRHPQRDSVTSAFVGTSRSKVLRPQWFGIEGAVNASGNSYNEISYGTLLQLEAVRLRFRKLETVYVEASMLLRRPAQLLIEEDHRKYIPLLEAVLPLGDGLPGMAPDFAAQVAAARAAPRQRKSLLRQQRDKLRLTELLPGGSGGRGAIPVLQDQQLSLLRSNGERAAMVPRERPRADQLPEIGSDNVKVQRLRELAAWHPWDGLFDMVARWGRLHGIQVVFFQPAVRSDLYRFQLDYGLDLHVRDMERVARQYQVPFIDFNLPELGYMRDWGLFVDEDHMETCLGIFLLHAGMAEGVRRFQQTGELLPRPVRQELETRYAERLKRCPARPSALP